MAKASRSHPPEELPGCSKVARSLQQPPTTRRLCELTQSPIHRAPDLMTNLSSRSMLWLLERRSLNASPIFKEVFLLLPTVPGPAGTTATTMVISISSTSLTRLSLMGRARFGLRTSATRSQRLPFLRTSTATGGLMGLTSAWYLPLGERLVDRGNAAQLTTYRTWAYGGAGSGATPVGVSRNGPTTPRPCPPWLAKPRVPPHECGACTLPVPHRCTVYGKVRKYGEMYGTNGTMHPR
jgi:hypothetical protein